jgi:hypothetical protein
MKLNAFNKHSIAREICCSHNSYENNLDVTRCSMLTFRKDLDTAGKERFVQNAGNHISDRTASHYTIQYNKYNTFSHMQLHVDP